MNQQINLLEGKISVARRNILSMIVLTLVNLTLSVFHATISFPFSASFPIFILEIGKEIQQEMNSLMPTYISVSIAIFIIGIYYLFYQLSKKKSAFFVVILVLFSLDSLLILWLSYEAFDASLLIDIAFHGWVMYYIISAVQSGSKLKKLYMQELEQDEPVTDEDDRFKE